MDYKYFAHFFVILYILGTSNLALIIKYFFIFLSFVDADLELESVGLSLFSS